MSGPDFERLKPAGGVVAKPRLPPAAAAAAARKPGAPAAGSDFANMQVHPGPGPQAAGATPPVGVPATAPVVPVPVQAAPAVAPGRMAKTLDRFGHDSATLTGGHGAAIKALAGDIADHLAAEPGARMALAITGHTDTSGEDKHNVPLGLRRAQATKAALERELTRRGVAADRIRQVLADSLGESILAKPTADGVREPANRRVEVSVEFDGPAVVPPTTAPGPEPDAPAAGPPIDLRLPRDYKLPEETLWERMERERKQIEDYDRKHPRVSRSPVDVLVEGATKVLEPVIRKLPESLRKPAREGIRKAIEKGSESACESAIDATGVTGEAGEALKAGCKAAIKTKPGEKP